MTDFCEEAYVLKRKVVFITPSDLFDQYGNGGSKGSKKNYDLLTGRFGKENVAVILLKKPDYKLDKTLGRNLICFNQPMNNFQALFVSLWGCKRYFPWDERKIYEVIQNLEAEYVFFDGTTIGKLLKKKASYKQIVFFHNVEVDYSWNKVKNESIAYFPAYLATKLNERRAVWADMIGCLNSRDARLIEERYGRKPDYFLPVTFKDTFDDSKARVNQHKRLLFLGSFFGPNQSGIEWFIENVMARIPEVELDIVGKGFEVKKAEYEKCRNVHVIGTVEDSSEYYYNHDIVVMPIFYGAGMKVKTAEAMMYGRIILASDEALEGYEVEDVKGIYRCNTAAEYIKIIRLVLDEQRPLWQSDVRELFLDKYETSVLQSTMDRVFDRWEHKILGRPGE